MLPALGWAEQDGTFTNLERRVQRAPKAVDNPHTRAAPDWMILDHLARRMGVDWPFADLRGVTKEITRAVPLYAGLTWDALGEQGMQWDAAQVRPAPSYQQVQQDDPTEDEQFPLVLIQGTVLYDGGTMFWCTQELHNMAHGPVATLHPADAERMDLAAGTPVVVRSRDGSLDLTVALDPIVQPGTVWIPQSLPGAPVGALLDGGPHERVRIERR